MSVDAQDLNTMMRRLPKMDELLESADFASLLEDYSRAELLYFVHAIMAKMRQDIKAGSIAIEEGAGCKIVMNALSEKMLWHRHRRKQHVINATGIVLHTGLGRAYLPDDIRQRVADCSGYTNLEVDVHSGQRNQREEYLCDLLCCLTGAEAATVVNNNAAATMLIINTFAEGKETIVSRGELVEIGGSFRVPEVLAKSQSIMVEVGATNKTHLTDYEEAIAPATGLLLKVHTSNFVVKGFTASVSNEDLVALGAKHGVAVAEDLGSGAVYDLFEFGLEGEPLVSDSLASGLTALCFSGDKLIGGPQAGIILGKRSAIKAIRANPLYRALRVDKMSLAALETCIEQYLHSDQPSTAMPTGQMLGVDLDELERRGRKIVEATSNSNLKLELFESVAQPGSGSLPDEQIESRALVCDSKDLSAEQLAYSLRHCQTPIFSRIQDDQVILDLIAVAASEDTLLIEGLSKIATRK